MTADGHTTAPAPIAADPKSALEDLRQLFNAVPDFQAAEAAHYVATYSAAARDHFWSAPRDLFRDPSDLKSTFETIYDHNVWRGGSGAGSDLHNTVLYAAYVQHLIDRFGARTIVDLGCGDWRFSKYLDLRTCEYLGVDIVPSVIAANTAAYGNTHIRFEATDITAFSVPPCDLLLCKDVMQHLSNANVQAILARSTVAGRAVFTNDYHSVNEDCANGSTRPLDITAPPFAFPATPRLAFAGKVSFLAQNTR